MDRPICGDPDYIYTDSVMGSHIFSVAFQRTEKEKMFFVECLHMCVMSLRCFND